jgi:DNA-binding response OmpR family regulator
MRVLICEDDGLLASELEAIVVEAGCDLAGTARTAEEARAIAADSDPRMAIVDLHLGDGRSGPGLAAELAAAGIRIVVVSGDTTVDPELARIGHVFLAKPVHPATLRALVAPDRRSADLSVAAA